MWKGVFRTCSQLKDECKSIRLMSLLSKNDGGVNAFWIFLCFHTSLPSPLIVKKSRSHSVFCVSRVASHDPSPPQSISASGNRCAVTAIRDPTRISAGEKHIFHFNDFRYNHLPCYPAWWCVAWVLCLSRCWSPWFHFCPRALKQQCWESWAWWILASLLPFCWGTRAAHLTSPQVEK